MMKQRLFNTWEWLKKRPIAMLNLIGLIIIIIGGSITLTVLMTQEIDVLEDWTVQTSKKSKAGQLPVYNPGGTLEFVSTSRKVRSAEGTTTRVFDCDATSGMSAREISLSPVPANRAPGYNPPRENVIIVPAVNEFNKLPRTCRVVFNICYKDVVLWRDHCESARTNNFLVEEEKLNANQLRIQIEELNTRIQLLESQLVSLEQPSGINSVAILESSNDLPSRQVNPEPNQARAIPNPSTTPPSETTPEVDQSTEPSQQGLVQRVITNVLNPVNNLLRGVF